ncbi:hypothetical protein FHJ30_09240 [Arthrobacter sp. BB-1]|uniref:HEPN domain-containing protein n=1 Tax=unclassified Arthrobacter TaxID=235627 RepID=UPI0011125C6A|nr:hypothetical protein FHJ30_09240 [Arthrobacter sp. BB-1]
MTMQNPPHAPWDLNDPEDEPLLKVSSGVTSVLLNSPQHQTAVDALNADSDFERMWSAGTEFGTFFQYPGGGSIVQRETLSSSLIIPALRRANIEAPSTEDEFCALVLENLAEMKRAIRGEPVTIQLVHGLAGLSVPDGLQIATPWGVIRGIPAGTAQAARRARLNPTTAVLVGEHETTPLMGRGDLSEPMLQDEFQTHENQVRHLLPLAFALASEDGRVRAPSLTFSTRIVPFLGGWGSSGSPFGIPKEAIEIREPDIERIVHWANVLDANHNQSLDIAARRLVSAVNERYDPDDRLVDAVICWESLVGTKIETVNRVTSSLAILLEENIALRSKMMTSLGNTYSVRSQLVHGQKVKDGDRQKATEQAVDVAVQALRAIYSAGEPWVSEASDVRSKRIVLGEWDNRTSIR